MKMFNWISVNTNRSTGLCCNDIIRLLFLSLWLQTLLINVVGSSALNGVSNNVPSDNCSGVVCRSHATAPPTPPPLPHSVHNFPRSRHRVRSSRSLPRRKFAEVHIDGRFTPDFKRPRIPVGATDPDVKIEPPRLEFGRRPLCIATVREIKITRDDDQGTPESLTIYSVESSDEHFYTSPFTSTELKHGETLPVQVILLPRTVTALLGYLTFHTSRGNFVYHISAEGIDNEYRLKPLINNIIAIGDTYHSSISLFNPLDEVLTVHEILSTDTALEVNVPQSGPTGNIVNSAEAGAQAAKRWRLQPKATHEIAKIQYVPESVGQHTAYIHVSTSTEDFVIPVSLRVVQGGIKAEPSSLAFGTFVTNEADFIWSDVNGPVVKSSAEHKDMPSRIFGYSELDLRWLQFANVSHKNNVALLRHVSRNYVSTVYTTMVYVRQQGQSTMYRATYSHLFGVSPLDISAPFDAIDAWYLLQTAAPYSPPGFPDAVALTAVAGSTVMVSLRNVGTRPIGLRELSVSPRDPRITVFSDIEYLRPGQLINEAIRVSFTGSWWDKINSDSNVLTARTERHGLSRVGAVSGRLNIRTNDSNPVFARVPVTFEAKILRGALLYWSQQASWFLSTGQMEAVTISHPLCDLIGQSTTRADVLLSLEGFHVPDEELGISDFAQLEQRCNASMSNSNFSDGIRINLASRGIVLRNLLAEPLEILRVVANDPRFITTSHVARQQAAPGEDFAPIRVGLLSSSKSAADFESLDGFTRRNQLEWQHLAYRWQQQLRTKTAADMDDASCTYLHSVHQRLASMFSDACSIALRRMLISVAYLASMPSLRAEAESQRLRTRAIRALFAGEAIVGQSIVKVVLTSSFDVALHDYQDRGYKLHNWRKTLASLTKACAPESPNFIQELDLLVSDVLGILHDRLVRNGTSPGKLMCPLACPADTSSQTSAAWIMQLPPDPVPRGPGVRQRDTSFSINIAAIVCGLYELVRPSVLPEAQSQLLSQSSNLNMVENQKEWEKLSGVLHYRTIAVSYPVRRDFHVHGANESSTADLSMDTFPFRGTLFIFTNASIFEVPLQVLSGVIHPHTPKLYRGRTAARESGPAKYVPLYWHDVPSNDKSGLDQDGMLVVPPILPAADVIRPVNSVIRIYLGAIKPGTAYSSTISLSLANFDPINLRLLACSVRHDLWRVLSLQFDGLHNSKFAHPHAQIIQIAPGAHLSTTITLFEALLRKPMWTELFADRETGLHSAVLSNALSIQCTNTNVQLDIYFEYYSRPLVIKPSGVRCERLYIAPIRAPQSKWYNVKYEYREGNITIAPTTFGTVCGMQFDIFNPLGVSVRLDSFSGSRGCKLSRQKDKLPVTIPPNGTLTLGRYDFDAAVDCDNQRSALTPCLPTFELIDGSAVDTLFGLRAIHRLNFISDLAESVMFTVIQPVVLTKLIAFDDNKRPFDYSGTTFEHYDHDEYHMFISVANDLPRRQWLDLLLFEGLSHVGEMQDNWIYPPFSFISHPLVAQHVLLHGADQLQPIFIVPLRLSKSIMESEWFQSCDSANNFSTSLRPRHKCHLGPVVVTGYNTSSFDFTIHATLASSEKFRIPLKSHSLAAKLVDVHHSAEWSSAITQSMRLRNYGNLRSLLQFHHVAPALDELHANHFAPNTILKWSKEDVESVLHQNCPYGIAVIPFYRTSTIGPLHITSVVRFDIVDSVIFETNVVQLPTDSEACAPYLLSPNFVELNADSSDSVADSLLLLPIAPSCNGPEYFGVQLESGAGSSLWVLFTSELHPEAERVCSQWTHSSQYWRRFGDVAILFLMGAVTVLAVRQSRDFLCQRFSKLMLKIRHIAVGFGHYLKKSKSFIGVQLRLIQAALSDSIKNLKVAFYVRKSNASPRHEFVPTPAQTISPKETAPVIHSKTLETLTQLGSRKVDRPQPIQHSQRKSINLNRISGIAVQSIMKRPAKLKASPRQRSVDTQTAPFSRKEDASNDLNELVMRGSRNQVYDVCVRMLHRLHPSLTPEQIELGIKNLVKEPPSINLLSTDLQSSDDTSESTSSTNYRRNKNSAGSTPAKLKHGSTAGYGKSKSGDQVKNKHSKEVRTERKISSIGTLKSPITPASRSNILNNRNESNNSSQHSSSSKLHSTIASSKRSVDSVISHNSSRSLRGNATRSSDGNAAKGKSSYINVSIDPASLFVASTSVTCPGSTANMVATMSHVSKPYLPVSLVNAEVDSKSSEVKLHQNIKTPGINNTGIPKITSTNSATSAVSGGIRPAIAPGFNESDVARTITELASSIAEKNSEETGTHSLFERATGLGGLRWSSEDLEAPDFQENTLPKVLNNYDEHESSKYNDSPSLERSVSPEWPFPIGLSANEITSSTSLSRQFGSVSSLFPDQNNNFSLAMPWSDGFDSLNSALDVRNRWDHNTTSYLSPRNSPKQDNSSVNTES